MYAAMTRLWELPDGRIVEDADGRLIECEECPCEEEEEATPECTFCPSGGPRRWRFDLPDPFETDAWHSSTFPYPTDGWVLRYIPRSDPGESCIWGQVRVVQYGEGWNHESCGDGPTWGYPGLAVRIIAITPGDGNTYFYLALFITMGIFCSADEDYSGGPPIYSSPVCYGEVLLGSTLAGEEDSFDGCVPEEVTIEADDYPNVFEGGPFEGPLYGVSFHSSWTWTDFPASITLAAEV